MKILEDLLSPSLQKEIHMFIYKKIVKLNEVFCKNERTRNFIIHHLKNKLCRPEEEITIQGSKGNSMFFIASGTCEVYLRNLDGEE